MNELFQASAADALTHVTTAGSTVAVWTLADFAAAIRCLCRDFYSAACRRGWSSAVCLQAGARSALTHFTIASSVAICALAVNTATGCFRDRSRRGLGRRGQRVRQSDQGDQRQRNTNVLLHSRISYRKWMKVKNDRLGPSISFQPDAVERKKPGARGGESPR